MSTLSKIIADREIAAKKAELEAKRKPKKRTKIMPTSFKEILPIA